MTQTLIWIVGSTVLSWFAYKAGRCSALLDVNARVFRPWLTRLSNDTAVAEYTRAWNDFASIDTKPGEFTIHEEMSRV